MARRYPFRSLTRPLLAPRSRLAACAGAALVFTSSLALAWTRSAEFEARVHGHAFTKVSLESADCSLRYELQFAAPPEGYPKTGTGYYRFHARIRLDEGRSIVTKVFANRTPGKRTFTGELDTTADGCWAKEPRKLFGVDVEGCRGRACTPDPFE